MWLHLRLNPDLPDHWRVFYSLSQWPDPTVEQPQPRWGRSAAMVRRTLDQYVAVCPRLQLTSHTQPTSPLSRIKCERYIFIKECVRSFVEVRHYCWLCFRLYLYYVYVLCSCMWLYNTASNFQKRMLRTFAQIVYCEKWTNIKGENEV